MLQAAILGTKPNGAPRYADGHLNRSLGRSTTFGEHIWILFLVSIQCADGL